MIIGNPEFFMIHYDMVLLSDRFSFGAVNFIIDHKFFPGTGIYHTFESVLGCLKSGAEDFATLQDSGSFHFTNNEFSNPDFYEDENRKLVKLHIAELEDSGLGVRVGRDGNEERAFITMDFEETWVEYRFPLGTVESVLRQLPYVEELKAAMMRGDLPLPCGNVAN